MNKYIYMLSLALVSVIALLVDGTAHAVTAPPQSFVYQGRLYQANGTTPLTDTVSFKLEIYDPSGLCLLYSQQVSNYNLSLSNGAFSVAVGSPTGDASRTGTDPGLSMVNVFSNSYNHTARAGCASFDAANMSATARRKLKVTVNNVTQGNTVTVLSPMQNIETTPYATVAETVQGYGPNNLVKISATTTQSAVDNLTAQATPLINLAAQATTILNMASSYSVGGNMTVATPVASTDAVNKNYTDTKLGGFTLDVTTTAPTTTGQSIRWNAGSNKWEVYSPPISGAIANVDIAAGAAIVDTKLDTISSTGKVANSATTAVSTNTANTIVLRDGSGNFAAGNITATKVTGLSAPTAVNDAATKAYVDASGGSGTEPTKCPAGMSLVPGTTTMLAYCIDTDRQGWTTGTTGSYLKIKQNGNTSATYEVSAMDACDHRGFQVCTKEQWKVGCNANVATTVTPALTGMIDGNYEWTSSVYSFSSASSSNMVTAGGASCTSVSSALSSATAHGFRCCTRQ